MGGRDFRPQAGLAAAYTSRGGGGMPHIDRRCEGGVVDVFWCAGYDDSLLCSDDCFCFQIMLPFVTSPVCRACMHKFSSTRIVLVYGVCVFCVCHAPAVLCVSECIFAFANAYFNHVL